MRTSTEPTAGIIVIVISRQRDESLVINDDIVIVVVENRGEKFRLGIDAPKEAAIYRSEVWEAIKRNEALAQKPPEPPIADEVASPPEGTAAGGERPDTIRALASQASEDLRRLRDELAKTMEPAMKQIELIDRVLESMLGSRDYRSRLGCTTSFASPTFSSPSTTQ